MTATMNSAELANRLDLTMAPDDRRVVIKLFVPGEDAQLVHNRASALIERILRLDDAEIARLLVLISEHADACRRLVRRLLQLEDFTRVDEALLDEARLWLDTARRLLEQALHAAWAAVPGGS